MIERAAGVTLERTRVCIAVPTFRRPALLARLLGGLAAQRALQDYDVRVLVIDNDALPSVHALVEAKRVDFPFSLHYAHHAEPGLASVRNFALAFARGTHDYVAMIDDDECPEPQWLAELLRVAGTTRADAIVGPVPQCLAADAPRWLRAGRFYDLPVANDGAPIAFGYSGNCLLRLASLERFGVAFDRRLDFAGGEDLLFFRQLLARGAKLAFAAQAVAAEAVGPERLRAAYVLRLNFRRGNTLAMCDRRLRGRTGILLRALKGCARIARGTGCLLPRAALRGRTGALAALCDVAHGFGSLAGLTGYVFNGYARVGATRG